jgi:hypothetical protein
MRLLKSATRDGRFLIFAFMVERTSYSRDLCSVLVIRRRPETLDASRRLVIHHVAQELAPGVTNRC